MCGSMADIQYATAEIRRGKKKERKKEEETTWQKYRPNGLPYPIGRPYNERGPAVEHRSLADVLSLSCARLVDDG